MVDVVVVNWNAGPRLARCLRSFAGSPLVASTVVVDNASSDGSVIEMPNVTVIRNTTNVGYGTACNQGAALGSAEFILFLNPDAEIRHEALAGLLSHTSDPSVAVIAPALRTSTGRLARGCCRNPSLMSMLAEIAAVDRIFPSTGFLMREWDHKTTSMVFHVIGACVLLRRAAFESLRGFDERFFMYFEDLDLSVRVARRGWKTLYVAGIEATHEGCACSSQIPGRRMLWLIRSRISFCRKHFGTVQSAILIGAMLLMESPIRVAQWAVARITSGAHEKENEADSEQAAFWHPHGGRRRHTGRDHNRDRCPDV